MNMLTWELQGKNVLLRIDGNVPLSAQGCVQNDFRLRAVIPTVDYLSSRGAQITIITHLGRPKGYDKRFSTRPLQDWFNDHGYDKVQVKENLRFLPGEKGRDSALAQELARGMDYYINDAWGVMHRDDTSVTLVPQLFVPERRSYGFLVEQELRALRLLRENPEEPYVVILGGGKIETKLAYLNHLIKTHHVQTIALLPGVSILFSLLHHLPVGISPYDESQKDLAEHFIETAKESRTELMLPQDYVYAHGDVCGMCAHCSAHNVPADALLMSPGPISLNQYKKSIQKARTIFINGVSGFPLRPETMESFRQILCMIADSQAYAVVGGGDSVAEVQRLRLAEAFDFCSTGGGSTLAYISGCVLPGLEALEQ